MGLLGEDLSKKIKQNVNVFNPEKLAEVIDIKRRQSAVGVKKTKFRSTLKLISKRKYTKKLPRSTLDRTGFVKVFRDIPLELQKNLPLRGTWFGILLAAPWSESEITINGKLIKLNPGHFILQGREFAEYWGIPNSTFQDHLKLLVKLNLLTILDIPNRMHGPVNNGENPVRNGEKSCQKLRVLSICNWKEIYTLQEECPVRNTETSGQQLQKPGQQFTEVPEIIEEIWARKKEEEEKKNTLVPSIAKHEREPSSQQEPEQPKAAARRKTITDFPEYNEILKGYPERDGRQGNLKTLVDKVAKITRSGRREELKQAIANYNEYCVGKEMNETQFVMMFSTFLTSKTKGWEAWIDIHDSQPEGNNTGMIVYRGGAT